MAILLFLTGPDGFMEMADGCGIARFPEFWPILPRESAGFVRLPP